MSITREVPNTIHLGGPGTEVGDVPASEAITPGMLIELVASGGVEKYQKHATAGAAPAGRQTFAMEQSMLNQDVDDAYAAGDLVQAIIGVPGTTIWAIIASGANIAVSDKLSSAGNGKLQAVGGGTAMAVAKEAKNNSAGPGDARIRVELI